MNARRHGGPLEAAAPQLAGATADHAAPAAAAAAAAALARLQLRGRQLDRL